MGADIGKVWELIEQLSLDEKRKINQWLTEKLDDKSFEYIKKDDMNVQDISDEIAKRG